MRLLRNYGQMEQVIFNFVTTNQKAASSYFPLYRQAITIVISSGRKNIHFHSWNPILGHAMVLLQ